MSLIMTAALMLSALRSRTIS